MLILRMVYACCLRPLRDDSGAVAAEYAFIALVIALVMVVGAAGLGETVDGLFDDARAAF